MMRISQNALKLLALGVGTAALAGKMLAPAVADAARKEPSKLPTPKPGSSWIEGRVLDARTLEPIANARVWARGSKTDSAANVRSDESGKFRASVGPSGRYYGRYYMAGAAVGYSPSDLSIISGLQTPLPILKRDVLLARLGVLRGRVRDARGRALAGATVSARSDYPSHRGDAITGRDGTFRISGLSANEPVRSGTRKAGGLGGLARYQVLVQHPSFSFVQKTVAVLPRYKAENEAVLCVTLGERALLQGRLFVGAKPLSIELYARPRGEEAAPLNASGLLGRSGEDGCFSLLLSAPQSYEIALDANGFVSQTVKIKLWPGQKKFLRRNLKPSRYGSIRGRVFDMHGRPVQGAIVELWSPLGSEGRFIGKTDRRGRYSEAHVETSTVYRVHAMMPRSQTSDGPKQRNVRVRPGRATIVNLRGDNINPTLRIQSPRPNARVQGIIEILVRARDDAGLRTIALSGDYKGQRVDAQGLTWEQLYSGKPRPRSRVQQLDAAFKLDTRQIPNGRRSVAVEAYDHDGNMARQTLTLNVENHQVENPSPAQRHVAPSGRAR